MITDETIHNIFQKNPCKNTDYNQGSTLAKTWDINGHRISNTHLWSVISMPIWYAYVYYHDYYKNNSPKNPYKSTGYDTQFLHPYLEKLPLQTVKYKLWPKWFVDETYYGRTGVWTKRLASLYCMYNAPKCIYLFKRTTNHEAMPCLCHYNLSFYSFCCR
jgi:hypothetical protein